MTMHISNLENNNLIYELDTLNQQQVKGGFGGDNTSEYNSTKNSLIDGFTLSINGEVVASSQPKYFSSNFVFRHNKVNLNTSASNQVLTSGNAQVTINGQKL